MALINCKECKKRISTNAPICPHCGFVYKKQGPDTKKIVLISIVTLVIAAILFVAFTYLILDFLPVVKVENKMKKYYGTWELVDNNFDNIDGYINNYVGNSYTIKKEIEINKNNSEHQTGSWGCGLNAPHHSFAISNSNNAGCTDDYYLVASAASLIEPEKENEFLKSVLICFDIKDDKLIQRACDLIEESKIKNHEITYKLKK